jgi:hypothetical protein
VREHRLPIQRACRIVGLSRTAFYRVPRSSAERDSEVIAALGDMVAKRPRWGFWKCYDRLRIEGRPWNHKRVHRVYCALRLNLPRRTRRRVPTRHPRECARVRSRCLGPVLLSGPCSPRYRGVLSGHRDGRNQGRGQGPQLRSSHRHSRRTRHRWQGSIARTRHDDVSHFPELTHPISVGSAYLTSLWLEG